MDTGTFFNPMDIGKIAGCGKKHKAKTRPPRVYKDKKSYYIQKGKQKIYLRVNRKTQKSIVKRKVIDELKFRPKKPTGKPRGIRSKTVREPSRAISAKEASLQQEVDKLNQYIAKQKEVLDPVQAGLNEALKPDAQEQMSLQNRHMLFNQADKLREQRDQQFQALQLREEALKEERRLERATHEAERLRQIALADERERRAEERGRQQQKEFMATLMLLEKGRAPQPYSGPPPAQPPAILPAPLPQPQALVPHPPFMREPAPVMRSPVKSRKPTNRKNPKPPAIQQIAFDIDSDVDAESPEKKVKEEKKQEPEPEPEPEQSKARISVIEHDPKKTLFVQNTLKLLDISGSKLYNYILQSKLISKTDKAGLEKASTGKTAAVIKKNVFKLIKQRPELLERMYRESKNVINAMPKGNVILRGAQRKAFIKQLIDKSFLLDIDLKDESMSRGFGSDESPKEGGLYDSQIDNAMAKFPDYTGTFSSDEINQLPTKKFQGFVMNKDKSDEEGSHWVAVVINGTSEGPDEYSILYYDSFGDEPPADFAKQIHTFITNKVKPNVYLKYKVNNIKHQDASTSSCGVHAMEFLKSIFAGGSFKSATGWKRLKGLDQTGIYEEQAGKKLAKIRGGGGRFSEEDKMFPYV